MTTRKRNNTQRRGASSKAARMKLANVKRMFMAFLWLAIVVGLPYYIGREKKSFYPDFLIVRSDPALDYVVDILEPHGNQYADNLPKAKALAEYAKAEDRLGRIQLIHKTTDAGGTDRFIRLDLTDIAVRDKVLRAFSNDELDHIFETDGIIE